VCAQKSRCADGSASRKFSTTSNPAIRGLLLYWFYRTKTGRREAALRQHNEGVTGGGRNQMLLGRPEGVRLYTLSLWDSCLWASKRLESTWRWHRLHEIERLPIRPSAIGGALASFRRTCSAGFFGV